jgi:hypothetical protein
MATNPERAGDGDLIAACLAHDDDGWKRLDSSYSGWLLVRVRRKLRRRGYPLQWAEDIVENVLCDLAADDGRKLRLYDPRRGPLAAYLVALAQQAIDLGARKEGAQRPRMVPLPPELPDPRTNVVPFELVVEEWLARMPGEVERYCRQCLLSSAYVVGIVHYTPGYARQLKHHALREFRNFLDGE